MTLSKERIEAGKYRVGASEIGALIVGDEGKPIHPYLTPLTLFQRKQGDILDDAVKRHQGWGTRMEPLLLSDFAEANGYTQRGSPGTLISHRFRNLLATPDDLLEKQGLVYPADAKNVQQLNPHRKEWGPAGSDEAPLLYVAQVAIQIEITLETMPSTRLAEKGWLVASLGGAPPDGWFFSRDEELVGQMDDLAAKFVTDCLKTGRPPDRWWQDPAASEYVKNRYREVNDVMLAPDAALRAIGEQVATLTKKRKLAEKEEAAAKALLCSQIGSATGIEGVAKWTLIKELKEKSTNWEAVAQEVARLVPESERARLPDIKEQFTAERIKRKAYRRLYVNGAPEEEG